MRPATLHGIDLAAGPDVTVAITTEHTTDCDWMRSIAEALAEQATRVGRAYGPRAALRLDEESRRTTAAWASLCTRYCRIVGTVR